MALADPRKDRRFLPENKPSDDSVHVARSNCAPSTWVGFSDKKNRRRRRQQIGIGQSGVRFGSRCENFNVRRARRSIFEKLRDMRTDNAADIRLNAMLGNCIFYISPMYEFSHSLGQSLPTHSAQMPTFVRC
jgi:hypothetical protein